MSPHTAGGDGNVATVSWQEQFNRLRDADGQAFEAGGIRPSTCPVPGTKRVSGNAWGKPWHGEACQSASWQDRSLPVVWQEQTPFSTAQRSSTEASWGRRTKPPSSKYYNYSCLDSLEPDIDEFSMQQSERAVSAGGAAGAAASRKKKKKSAPVQRRVTSSVGFQSRTLSRDRSGRSPQITPYVSPYKGWKPSTPAPNCSRTSSMPREMLGYFSGLKLNAWDSVSPPPSEKKCNNSEALCCEGDNEEVKAPEGPSSGQETSTCQLSQNHNDASPVSEEAWGITTNPRNDSGSSKRAQSNRLRSPPRKPHVKSSRALIPTRQSSLRQADNHRALVVVGGTEARGSMSQQHEKAAAVKRGKGKGSRGIKSPQNGARNANQAKEPPVEAMSNSLASATENTAAEPAFRVQVFQFMDLQHRPVIRRPRPNLFPEPGSTSSSSRPNSTALHAKRMASPTTSLMPQQRPSAARATQQRAMEKANRFPSKHDAHQLIGDGVAPAMATST